MKKGLYLEGLKYFATAVKKYLHLLFSPFIKKISLLQLCTMTEPLKVCNFTLLETVFVCLFGLFPKGKTVGIVSLGILPHVQGWFC